MGFLFGSQTQASTQTVASGVSIQSSVYGAVVPVLYGQTRITGNLIWYGDFQAIAQNSGGSGGGKGGGGGGGGKGGGGGTTYDYKASFAFALCEGTIGAIYNVFQSKSATAWASSNLSYASGAITQSPWGYLTSKHPGQDLSYAGTAYVYAAAYDLGTSAQLPNLSYEASGSFGGAITTLPDADPKDVVTDVLTNTRYGVGFPSAKLGSLAVFSAYCRATGMVVSPLFDTQQDAASLLNTIVQDCNSEFVWSGASLTIVPYGDQSITANGATYTAPSAPLYSLGDDDFLDTGGGDPVQCSRARPSDKMNSVKLEWLDRSNHYNIAVVEAKDLASIQVYGLRADQPKQSHHFCDLGAATMSATLQLQRQSVRNQYTFTLGWQYCLLDPMDIIEITDSGLGLSNQWVRVLSIEEDDNGALKVTAEEYLGGTGAAPLYGSEAGSRYAANYNTAPGSVNTPMIFEPPAGLTGGTQQVWIGASGGANWGGADVWLSTDNTTYQRVGKVTGPARQGTLTATLASHADPDSSNTLAIDLSESNGALLSGTLADANNFQTICYVDGEIIAYETATLTGANLYSLTYLRRGVYGSTIGSHSSGTQFCRLDNNIVQIDLPAEYIGVTIYLKLTSFNHWGGGEEDLASVSPYSFSPTGVGGYVAPPTGIAMATGYVQQGDGTIQPYLDISWTGSTDPLFDSYDVQWSVHAANIWKSVKVAGNTVSHRVIPVAAGTAFDARVRAVRGLGGPFFSAWDQINNVTTVGKAAASGDPSSLTAYGGYQSIRLAWSPATDTDIIGYEVWQSPDGVTYTKIGQVLATVDVIGHLADVTTYWFAIRSVNTSGQTGNFISATATTTQVQTSGIGSGAVSSVNSATNSGTTFNTSLMTAGVLDSRTLSSATVTTNGGVVAINVTLDSYSVSAGVGGGLLDPSIGLYRDGTLLGIGFPNNYLRDFYYDTPSAGTHTYAIIAKATYVTGSGEEGQYTYGANSVYALTLKA